MKLISLFLLFLSLLLGIITPSKANPETHFIAATTFIDRSNGQTARLYEFSTLFRGEEKTRYLLGYEKREDLLSLQFAHLGLIYASPATGQEFYAELHDWPGMDSNGNPWNIFFLSVMKRSDGLLYGLSFKNYAMPGSPMSLGSLKAGYYNKTMTVTGEFFHSLGISSPVVRMLALQGEFFVDRLSFKAGGSAGQTFASYSQLAAGISTDTSEYFAGTGYTWNELTLSMVFDRAFQPNFRQDSFTVILNYQF